MQIVYNLQLCQAFQLFLLTSVVWVPFEDVEKRVRPRRATRRTDFSDERPPEKFRVGMASLAIGIRPPSAFFAGDRQIRRADPE